MILFTYGFVVRERFTNRIIWEGGLDFLWREIHESINVMTMIIVIQVDLHASLP